jgi:hypothetical protein
MTLTYRLVKGSALTFAEQDGNISDLDGRVVALEALDFANPIDAVTVSGNQLTFHYTTASGGGSDTVTLPTAQWNGRGNWLPSTVYAINDLVIDASRLYLVKIAHTSQLTFDAGYQIGGQNVYQFIFGPMGETEVATISASIYTLQGTDDLKYYRCTAISTVGIIVITIPSSTSVTIPVNSEITFRQCSDSLLFETESDVTLNIPDGFEASTGHVGATVTLKKIDVDEWDIFGALTAISA